MKDVFHDQSCEHCKTVIEPNRCLPCASCGTQIHIDAGGQLAWPASVGFICSPCYRRLKES